LLQRARKRQAAARTSSADAKLRSLEIATDAALTKSRSAVGALGGPERLPGPMIALIFFLGLCMASVVLLLLF
jgi:hypothetical protein